MKKIWWKLLLLGLFLSSVNANSQMLGFISMHEGYEKARTKAVELGLNAPSLMGAVTSTFSFEMAPGMPDIIGEIKTAGDDIGKATFWIYVFKENDKVVEIAAAKVIPMGGTIVAAEVDVLSNYGIEVNTSGSLYFDEIATSAEFVEAAINCSGYLPFEDNICIALNINPLSDIETTHRWIIFDYEEDITSEQHYCYCAYNYINNILCNTTGAADNNPTNLEVNIHPNPVSDNLVINNPNEIIFSEIAVYDINGKLQSIYPNNIEAINISSLPAGNYFISFTFNKTKLFKRFIVE